MIMHLLPTTVQDSYLKPSEYPTQVSLGTNCTFVPLNTGRCLSCGGSRLLPEKACELVGLLRDRCSSPQHQLDLWAVHGWTLRGLEHSITRAQSDGRKIECRNNCDSQDRLRKCGKDNASTIAEVASATSMPATVFATRMGLAAYQALLQDSLSSTCSRSSLTTTFHVPGDRCA